MRTRNLFFKVLTLAGVFLLAACTAMPNGKPASNPAAPHATAAPKSGGSLRYGLTLPVSGIDPHIHANSELGIALSGVYDTLIVQAADGVFHPSLAEQWQVSPDGKVYTFRLRRDVKFHDGTPFNAAAVVRNLERITNPATKSQKAVFLLGPYARSEAADPYAVQIVLDEPYAPLLDGLSQVYLGMASPAALDRWGDQYQLHQVGTGPFKFVSYTERQSLIIERNPEYAWAPEIRRHSGPAYLERIEFNFYADPATRLPALLSKGADIMGELPPQDAKQLQTGLNAQQFTLYPVAIPGQSVQFFLNTELPPLDDPRVRHALLLATDRPGLVRAVFGEYSPVATGPLTAVTRGALGPVADVALVKHDDTAANDLLTEAGWVDTDGDGIREKGGRKLTLQGVLMSWGELPAVGTILQAQWKRVGIDLVLEQMPYPAALEAGRKGTHHLIPFSNSGTDPSLLRTFFHSSNIGGFNWSRINDAEVDAWLDEAQTLNDFTQRGALYLRVQERALSEAWIIPIRDPVNLNAAAARVQGLTYDVQGWWPVLYDVWLAP